ncbi:MAG: PspC domain-containing protein [Chloroflexi bacterium]|nr:PspC domain-containing protein [Chloroflexota bacterium]
MEKRLYRSRTDRMIWGVCGGLAKYFDIDPVLVRVIFILLIFAGGIGIIGYIILALVVPVESSQASEPKDVIRENVEEMKQTATSLGSEIRSSFVKEEGTPAKPEGTEARTRYAIGILLLVVGILFLLATLNIFWWFNWRYLWPVVLIAVGLLVIVGTRRK